MTVPGSAPPIRIVYFGTPEFAVRALRALHEDERFDIALVVTQPDRPAGRGRKFVMPAVKQAALGIDLPVYQPDLLRTAGQRQPLVATEADLFVVAAYGVIFGPKMLAIPPHGCLNLHASILPAYRGASPISAAIDQGDPTTGVTLMKMEAGLDTGPVIGVRTLSIASTDTTQSLTERLAAVGAELAVDLVPSWVAGEITALPQPEGVSLTRPLTKADGWLDWRRPAGELERHVRAMWPWPRAWTTIGLPDGSTRPVQVHEVSLVGSLDQDQPITSPGIVEHGRDELVVTTGNGGLRLELVQEAGGRPVPGVALIASGQVSAGTVLGGSGAPAPQPPPIVLVRA